LPLLKFKPSYIQYLSLCPKSEGIQWSLHKPQQIKNSALFKITRQAMYVQCNIQASSLNHFCTRKVKIITYSECVFVALFIQHAMHMQNIILSPVTYPALPYFFRLSHKRHDFREKSHWTKHVFWFSIQLLSETFLILGRIQRDMIEMCIGLHVKYPIFLSDFNKNRIFLRDFQKITKYQILRKSLQWKPSCSMRTDRRKDLTTLNSRFSQVCKHA